MNAISKLAVRGMLGAGVLALCGGSAANAMDNAAYRNNDTYDNTAWSGNATAHALERGKITTLRGIDVSCTGIGEGSRADAPVSRLPVKLEMVGGYGQYLAGETVTLHNARGDMLLQTKCNAPWLMMKLPAGHYTARVNLPGARAQTVAFNAPRHDGERSVVVRFPNLMAGDPHRNGEG